MSVPEALRRGMAALSRAPRLLFLFYAATTVAALLVTAPVMAIAFQSLGESAFAHQMAPNLDLSWISELIAGYGAMPVMPVAAVFVGVGIIAGIVYLFLLGGALQVFCTGDPFFAGCGRNFWRLVRLTLVSLLFYAVVLFVSRAMNSAGRGIWGEGSEAGPLIHWSWFRAAVVLLLFGFVNLVFDYARIIVVAEDRRKTFRAAIAAFRFVWENLARTAGLYAAVCAIAALVFAAYLGISHAFAQSSVALVLLLLLVRQAMVLAKIWSRLLFCTTAFEMYTALQPPPEPVAAPAELTAPDVVPLHAQVALSTALGINAFEFVAAWNRVPECRAAAEAGLSFLGGNAGVVFDPARLLGHTAVLNRLADGVDAAALHHLIHRALDEHGVQCPHHVHEEPSSDGSLLFSVDAQVE